MNNPIYLEQTQLDRLKEWGDFPRVVLIDSVSFCNLRCSMCVHSSMTREKGFMSWELFCKLIDEIAENNVNTRTWMVFFGEALIKKKKKPTIFDMISYAKYKGLRDVVLNSNGILLDNESCHALIESGLDSIYIGVDAFVPETYDKIRVGGSYDRVVNNILALQNIKQRHRVDTPQIIVQFVEMEINSNEREDFIGFWSSHGIKVKVRPKVSWAGLIDAPNLVLDDNDRWPCHWSMQTFSVTNTGKVVTCAVDLDARYIAGDAMQQSIKEIWTGKLRELRQLHILKQFDKLPVHCKYCRDWQAARAEFY